MRIVIPYLMILKFEKCTCKVSTGNWKFILRYDKLYKGYSRFYYTKGV